MTDGKKVAVVALAAVCLTALLQFLALMIFWTFPLFSQQTLEAVTSRQSVTLDALNIVLFTVAGLFITFTPIEHE